MTLQCLFLPGAPENEQSDQVCPALRKVAITFFTFQKYTVYDALRSLVATSQYDEAAAVLEMAAQVIPRKCIRVLYVWVMSSAHALASRSMEFLPLSAANRFS